MDVPNARLTADVLAVCDTLGVSTGTEYFKDPQCLSSAKDLVLYLRRDSKDHGIRRLLGESQIVQRDLIPIYKGEDCSEDLSEVILRVLVNLTTPPLLLYDQTLPKDKVIQNHVMTMTRHLQGYKIAFVDEAFWTVVAIKLGKLIENMELILEVQKLTVERILILIRNVLHVPADPAEEMRNDDDANVHDQILWVMQKAGVLDLLLFIASSDSTTEFCMHLVETLTLIFRDHTGEQLAKTKLQESRYDMIKDAQELGATMRAEMAKKSQKQIPTRNFGGTYVVRGLKSASGNDLICHKPVQSLADLSLDTNKKMKKTPKNQIQKVEKNVTRRSTLSMRLLLKEFCTEFLNGSYNLLMRTVKDRLTRERGQENDEIYYLGAMRFFMEFNRYDADSEFTVARVSETMSIGCFHYVQGLIMNFHDLMVTDKEKIVQWSKRAHMALRAYQELLSTLFIMDKTPETTEAARVLQSSIFYLPEYRELCVGLLTSYEGRKSSRNYLCDLVETNHIFLKMLEEFTKERKILVRGKKRGRKSRGKKNKRVKTEGKKLKKGTEKDWEKVEGALTEFLEGPPWEAVEMIPFDGASEVAVDEQRGTAMRRIAAYLMKKEFNEAISLLRAAKDVWPDDDQVSKDTEISSLKSIFLSASPLPLVPTEQEGGEDEEGSEEADDENEIEDEEEYEERAQGTGRESEFDFCGFIQRYAHHKIVANYGNLFKHFDSLSEGVLHSVMKMFHRLAFDLGYPALLCQASIFRTFQSLLKAAKFQPGLEVATQFFKHFWPKFVKLATGNPKMFMEILFWKTGKDASEIQNGYAAYNGEYDINPEAEPGGPGTKKKKRSTKGILTEEEENEILVLAAEFSKLPPEKGIKQVDWINERLINGPKLKKLVQNFLKEKGVLVATRRFQKDAEGLRITSKAIISTDSDSSSDEGHDMGNENPSGIVSRPTVSSDSESEEGHDVLERVATPARSSNAVSGSVSNESSSQRRMRRVMAMDSSDSDAELGQKKSDSINNSAQSPTASRKPAMISSSDSENDAETPKTRVTKTKQKPRNSIAPKNGASGRRHSHSSSEDEAGSRQEKVSETEDILNGNRVNGITGSVKASRTKRIVIASSDSEDEAETSGIKDKELENDVLNGNAEKLITSSDNASGNKRIVIASSDSEHDLENTKGKEAEKKKSGGRKARQIVSDSD